MTWTKTFTCMTQQSACLIDVELFAMFNSCQSLNFKGFLIWLPRLRVHGSHALCKASFLNILQQYWNTWFFPGKTSQQKYMKFSVKDDSLLRRVERWASLVLVRRRKHLGLRPSRTEWCSSDPTIQRKPEVHQNSEMKCNKFLKTSKSYNHFQ